MYLHISQGKIPYTLFLRTGLFDYVEKHFQLNVCFKEKKKKSKIFLCKSVSLFVDKGSELKTHTQTHTEPHRGDINGVCGC